MKDPVDFCEIVNQAIAKHLEKLFGKSILMTLNYQLSQNDVSVLLVCSCPEKVADAFRNIFGAGGEVIESHCIQAAYQAFGLEAPDIVSLKDALEHLRKRTGINP